MWLDHHISHTHGKGSKTGEPSLDGSERGREAVERLTDLNAIPRCGSRTSMLPEVDAISLHLRRNGLQRRKLTIRCGVLHSFRLHEVVPMLLDNPLVLPLSWTSATLS
jgi:hypothetical protein